ncbi:MAG: hypothetical protein HY052_04605 [Proteobacteria bacterium]|nr:hypothetical protein [Pseudomonadota bacterium]
MSSRQKAIEELKKQIRLGRERLGPDGIKELEKLAAAAQKQKPAVPPEVPPGMLPYDKKAAAKALEIFLKNHGNPKEFEKRLRELLKQSSH